MEENIKCLEDLSKSLDKFIKELKIVSEEMYKKVQEKLIKFVENEYLNVSTSDSLSNKSNQ